MPDFSQLPSVDRLTLELTKETALPRALIAGFVKKEIEGWRARIRDGDSCSRQQIEAGVLGALRAFAASRLQPVINATGVLIHTNLGRSPLGARAAGALSEIATGYSNLEFNLVDGKRGPRAGYLESALAVLLESEAATAVNNCAAALVLTLRSLLKENRTEVIVSRGELVEIGGGFRIPEVLKTSGATLVEVGATNKTHLADYANAISGHTALILKVHRSNFYLEGFTDEPSIPELAELARSHDLPLVEDLGSGAIMNTDELAPIEHEPTPQESLRRGIDLLTFSGDKLLGGPQAGIIAGRADLVANIKAEPFFRAVRCDKLILTVLQECIDDYLTSMSESTPDVPILNFLNTPLETLHQRATSLTAGLSDLPATIEIVETTSQTGGGTMPKSQFPSLALKVTPLEGGLDDFSQRLRSASPAVVGYIQDDCFLLNLRTVFPSQDEALLSSLRTALS